MSRIDYDLTKVRAIVFDVDGVLSPSVIPMSDSGVPMRMANIKDGYAIQLAAKLGYKIAIISGAKVESLRVRFAALGIQDIFLGATMKLPLFKQWVEENGLTAEQVVYAGDDIPDIQTMQAAGLAVAPNDAAPEVKAVAGYISPYMGGYGVARDIIEQVLKANGEWMNEAKAFGW